MVGVCRGSGDRERLGSSSGPLDHPARHTLLGASIVGLNPLGLAFLGRPSMAIGQGAGSALSSVGDPHWVQRLAAPEPTPRSWLILGVHRLIARRSGGESLCLGSWRSPRGYHGAFLSTGTVSSGHILSTNALCRRFDGAWAAVPNEGVMTYAPMSSHFIWERGHVEQIWQRRSRGTWCACI